MIRFFTLRSWLAVCGVLLTGAPTASAQRNHPLAPALSSYVPAANALSVARTSAVALTFSEAMTAATASGAAIKMHGMQTGLRPATYTGGGTALITATPTSNLRPGELVSVTITTAAKALAGSVPLPIPVVWQYRAAAAHAPGTFAVAPHVLMGANSPRGHAVGDFDGDGDVDFAVCYYNTGGGQVFLNTGTGSFAAGATFTTGTGPVAVAAGDLDNDGDLDILVVNRVSSSISVRLNNGTGILSPGASIALGGGSLAQTADLGDIDGDGDLDFVVSRFGVDRVNVYRNNGAGGFAAGTAVVLTRPYHVRLADLDNDGDLDLAATRRGPGVGPVDTVVMVRLNAGTGIFSGVKPDVHVDLEPYDVQAGDVDGDGDNDLLTANTEAHTVSVRFNNGAAIFSAAQEVPVNLYPSNVELADVDGDGDLDFATANSLTISIRFNNGAGIFSGTMEVPTYDDPFGALAADVDGDNDLDFLVNNTTTNSESVLINQTLIDTTIAVTEMLIGSYRHVTVTGTGHVTLAAALGVLGTMRVEDGGELDPKRFPVVSSGDFILESGATLHTAWTKGLSLVGRDGPIQVADTRSFSTDASYIYDALAGAQVAGPGLPATVRSLTVTSPGHMTLSGPLAVRRLLLLPGASDLRLDAHDLTLLSSSAHTAMVVNGGAGQIRYTGAGLAEAQRYIAPLNTYLGAGYRHYASPVSASTVGSLDVTGRFTARVDPAYNVLPTPTTFTRANFPNVFGYDESRIAAPYSAWDTAWYSPVSRATALPPGRGYTVYLPPAAKVALRGILNGGAISTGALGHGAEALSGWHLLGNPYPAPLDWNLVRATPGAIPAGLDDAIYVWHPTGSSQSGTYQSFVGGIGSLPGGLIPMMQGFFMHTSAAVAAPGFTFQDAYRVSSYQNPGYHRATTDPRPIVELTLMGPDSTITDVAFVYWEDGATPGFDPHFDALKLPSLGTAPSLATGTARLSINGQPPLGSGQTLRLPLQVRCGQAGLHKLAVTTLRNLPAEWVVLLEDTITGLRQDLRQAATYRFAAERTGALPGRFWLHVGAATALPVPANHALLAAWPNPGIAGDQIQVLSTTGAHLLRLQDALGRIVRTFRFMGESTELQTTGLAPGLYQLTVSGSSIPAAPVRLILQ